VGGERRIQKDPKIEGEMQYIVLLEGEQIYDGSTKEDDVGLL
jgi:hypothetical protein